QEHRSRAVLSVQNNGRWDHRSGYSTQRRSGAEGWVIDRGVGHAIVEDKVLGDGLVIVADVNAQHGATEWFESFLDNLEIIDFCAARGTPLSPGVEDYYLAVKIGQVDFFTFLHQ